MLAKAVSYLRNRESERFKVGFVGPVLRSGLEMLGSPTWTRTRDLRINSPSLYRLSYQGMKRCA